MIQIDLKNNMDFLTHRRENLTALIRERYSQEYCDKILSFTLNDSLPLREASLMVLNAIPPKSGMCTIMSAFLCADLIDNYNIPAILVAGDLIIEGVPAFQTDVKIQNDNNNDTVIMNDWCGHCWVEVGGLICDISIGRTSDSASEHSNLRQFIHKTFGIGKGLLAFPIENSHSIGMVYKPKEVLSDDYITAITNSYIISR